MIKNKRLFYALSLASGITIGLVINYFKRGNRIKRLAKLTLDIGEISGNRGWSSDKFTEMMKSVGWRSTEQWCMYYAKAIYFYALPKLREGISELSGSTSVNWQKAKMGKLSIFEPITTPTPLIGDIAIWQRGNGTGHAGVVTKVVNDGMITIEGNANYINAPKNPTDSVVVNKHDKNIGSLHSKGSTNKLVGFLRLM